MNTKSDKFNIVIDSYDSENQLYITEDILLNYLNSNSDFIKNYFLIKHDKDSNGSFIHYHLIILLSKNYCKNTIITDISKSLLCNRSVINVRPLFDLVSSIRYLTHSDNVEKHLYSDYEVITNDKKLYMDLFNGIDCSSLTFETLVHIVRSSKCVEEVYSYIGLGNANKYRSIIKDLWWSYYGCK